MRPGARPALPILVALAVLTLAACAQPTPAAQSNSSAAPNPATSASPVAAAPKTLTIVIQGEPAGLNPYLTSGVTTAGNTQAFQIAHNYLVVRDDQANVLPQLAQSVISTSDGSWQVNADGTMDTTWKLRPNEKWQDGVPFTAEDLVFSYTVYKDPAVPNQSPPGLQQMSSVEAPDPQTLVVHWSTTFADADLAPGLMPLPEHLLADTYQNDRANFANSPVLGQQFVGLGPYRLTSWDPGVQMQFARFDDYYLGRPPLDNVVVQFIHDSNAMAAAALSGTADVVLPIGVDIATAEDLKQRWAGTGNQVLILPDDNVRYMEFQYRPEYARPANGLTNQLVRQGLANATDRASVADIDTDGASPPADSWLPPTNALYPQIEPSVPQFPYDLNLAQQRLADAGWARGSDGVLVDQSSGTRFAVDLWMTEGNSADKMTSVIADGWKAVGADVTINLVPAARASDAEYRLTFPGAQVTGHLTEQFTAATLDSRLIAGPENHWSAPNRDGYVNPTLDALYDRFAVTIDPTQRVEIYKQLVQEIVGDVAIMTLDWQYAPTLVLAGVHGVKGSMDNSSTWNIFQWTKD